MAVQSSFTKKWEPWRAGGDWSSAKNPRCRGEYHAEDFDGFGCGNGYRRSRSGNIGHGRGAVAWRLARWMGLGSRPVHRRTCCWCLDRRCLGGAICLSIPLRLLRRLLPCTALWRSLRVAAGVERIWLGARLRVTASVELFGPEKSGCCARRRLTDGWCTRVPLPAHLTSAKEYRQSGKRVRKVPRNRGFHGDSR